MQTKFWLMQVDTKSDRVLSQNDELGPKLWGGRGLKWKEQCKIDPKVQFLSIFLPLLRIRGENWSSEKCKGRVLMFQGQIRKITPLSTGKLGIFSF